MQTTAPTMTPPSQGAAWQYLVEKTRDNGGMQQLLNLRGSEGWELVNVVREESATGTRKTNRIRNASWTLFFKRSV